MTAPPAPQHFGSDIETERNRRIAQDFAHLFYGIKDVRRAFETYVVPDYIQHNPGIPDGREFAIAKLTPMFANPEFNPEVRKIIVDGPLVVLHILVRSPSAPRGAAVVDMYRLENGKIVEHWDVIQPIPAESANAHPMF